MNPDWVITIELAKTLYELSACYNRQLGLLIDRTGIVRCVCVGSSDEIFIPALNRFPNIPRRLRGLRFIRSSPTGHGIDQEDISDLAILRLDSFSVITGDDQQLDSIETIHLLPYQPGFTEDYIPYEHILNTDPHVNPFNYKIFIEELEERIVSETKALYSSDKNMAAVLFGVFKTRKGAGEHMQELSELATSAGFDVLGINTQIRPKEHPKTVAGPGKLKDVIITAFLKGADTIIFDNNLSPAQMKAVSELADIKIMDRTQLILEIFSQRAISNEGKIRVELARLRYFLPYLAGSYTNLSRITAGMESKGPGETKLELDKRKIAERINTLSDKLKKIEKNRSVQRKQRQRNQIPVVSIIGYTNAGKSTLLNAITHSDVYADDRLFATLDTSSKRIRFPEERDVIITDTVGFIRDLPADLAGSFKSTLEELYQSDIFLHVVDAASIYTWEHILSVRKVIRDMKLNDKPVIVVFNKCDLVSTKKMELLRADEPDAVFISTLYKNGLEALMERLHDTLFILRRSSLKIDKNHGLYF